MRDIDLTTRVAVVTGSGRGLGRSHVELLAKLGAKVVVNDVVDAPEVAAAICNSGGSAIASNHDISTPDGAQALVDLAVGTFGGLDILVNNAAMGRYSSFADTTIDEYRLVRRVGLDGTFYVTRAAWHVMAQAGYGRVVMTTSAHGLLGGENSASYSAVKGGIFGMMRSSALDGEKCGIKVNSICPAAFTPLVKSYVSDEWAEKMRLESPTALVSPLVALLCSDDCPANGVNFDVGSGRIGTITPYTNVGFYNRTQTPESILENWSIVIDPTDIRAYGSSRAATEAVASAKNAADARTTRLN